MELDTRDEEQGPELTQAFAGEEVQGRELTLSLSLSLSFSLSLSVVVCLFFWDQFGTRLGPFWDQFGYVLGPFWVNFETILGPFFVFTSSSFFWVLFCFFLSIDVDRTLARGLAHTCSPIALDRTWRSKECQF